MAGGEALTLRWRRERPSVSSSTVDGGEDLRTSSSGMISVGTITLDLPGRRALIDGWDLHLPAWEAALLMLLMRNAGRVLTTVELAQQVDGSYSTDPRRAVRRAQRSMRRLRRRLLVNPIAPTLIERVGSDGFRFLVIDVADQGHSSGGGER